MDNEIKATANTLGAIAKQYCVDLDTLNAWINVHADLKEKVKPYRDGRKLIYPPIIIDEIYKKLGKPV